MIQIDIDLWQRANNYWISHRQFQRNMGTNKFGKQDLELINHLHNFQGKKSKNRPYINKMWKKNKKFFKFIMKQVIIYQK